MIIKNKKASYLYEFIDSYVAGIVLVGTEVKSIRRGKASIKEAYCYFNNGELFIKGMHIAEHEVGDNHDPIRERKLLLTKKELKGLNKKMAVKGFTIIPVSLFLNSKGYVKIKIALAKGKRNYDKKMAIKERDIDRDTKNSVN
jgi:SsrA-binding protein